MWDEITYPFPNFNGCTIKFWELIGTHLLGMQLLIHAATEIKPC